MNDSQPSYTFNNTSVLIPLLAGQFLQSGISSNAAGDVFTVAEEGVYRIAYYINITTPQLVYANLMINGAEYDLSFVDTGDMTSNLINEVIISLSANSTVSLRLGSGESSVTADLASGCGAALVIQRLN